MYDSPRDRRNGEDADAPKGYRVHARRAYRSPQLVEIGTLKNVRGSQGSGRDITIGGFFTAPHQS